MPAQFDLASLDNPSWHSLVGPHASLAQVHGVARRYDPDISVFAALPDDRDAASWRDLAGLAGPGGQVTLTGVGLEPPVDWVVKHDIPAVQLIAVSVQAQPDDRAITLGRRDAEEMTALVERARPGPWRPRTYEMGNYLGIRVDGELVALAGERMHPTGWTEISAVSTDERFRGRGLAGDLVRALVHGIEERGEQAMLHASETNVNAIRLYLKLGFELRTPTRFLGLRAPVA